MDKRADTRDGEDLERMKLARTELRSFQLQAGRSQFVSGEIAIAEQRADGTIVWSHAGEPGNRYLIERSAEGFEWRPFQIITNLTSITTFTDVAGSAGDNAFYRSRMLD